MKGQLDDFVLDEKSDYKYIVLKEKYQNMVLVMDADGHIVGELKAPFHSSSYRI